MSNDQVKVLGFAMTGSLVLAGAAATLGRDWFGSGSAEGAASVFHVLMYGSAAILIMLLAWAPTLAKGLAEKLGAGSGRVIAMAISEGTALLGIVAAGFAGQSMWAIALALTGVLAVLRLMTSEAL